MNELRYNAIGAVLICLLLLLLYFALGGHL